MPKTKHIRNENKRKKINKKKNNKTEKQITKQNHKTKVFKSLHLRSSWTLASHNPRTAFACPSGQKAQWKGGSPSRDPSAPYRPGTITHRRCPAQPDAYAGLRSRDPLCAQSHSDDGSCRTPASDNPNANRSYQFHQKCSWVAMRSACRYRAVWRHVC